MSLLSRLISTDEVRAAIVAMENQLNELPIQIEESVRKAVRAKIGNRPLSIEEEAEVQRIKLKLFREQEAEINRRLSLFQEMERDMSVARTA